MKLTSLQILLGLIACISSAQAANIGVVGFYQSNNTDTAKVVKQILGSNEVTKICDMRRVGSTLAVQGNYKINANDNFFVLQCTGTVLGHKNAPKLLQSLSREAVDIILLEGPLLTATPKALTVSGVSKSYILKIADYNNLTPAKRQSDLIALNTLAQTRADHFNGEAFIRVQDAYGMERPDEVSIINYASAEKAEQFRKNNPDMLEAIGEFNTKHLTQFSYIFGQSSQ